MESNMRAFSLLIAAAACSLAACTTSSEPTETAAPVVADPNNPLAAPGYMAMAASSDQFEIQSSQLALQASQNPAVRSFAQMLIPHHQQTTATLMQAAQSAGLMPPPLVLLPPHQAMLDQLKGAGTGSGFDQAFKTIQIQAHQQALELHQNYANGGDVPTLRQAASSAVPIVQQHLTTAQSLNVEAMTPPPPPAESTAPIRSGERG
jgi:putative membrane protein